MHLMLIFFIHCCLLFRSCSGENSFDCTSQLKEFLGKTLPSSLMVSVFDTKFVPEAIKMAEAVHLRNLTFFGVCKDLECVQTFRTEARSMNCINNVCEAMIFHCPLYVPLVDEFLLNTTRCRGWREIQFVKVYALRDLLHLGIEVQMADLDTLPFVLRLLPFNRKDVDTVVFNRDSAPWPANWNFGFTYLNPTEKNKILFSKLAEEVKNTWDQSAWNVLMLEEEVVDEFKCRRLDINGVLGTPSISDTTHTHHIHDECVPGMQADQPLCLCHLEETLDFYSAPNCNFK